MAERQRLNLDLESLFPGDTITIGYQTVDIKPLGIKQLAVISRKLKGFGNLKPGMKMVLIGRGLVKRPSKIRPYRYVFKYGKPYATSCASQSLILGFSRLGAF